MKKVQHSTTIYLPRKHNEFFTRAIKARAQEVFGPSESLGRNSKYIIRLIKHDLKGAGLINEDGSPNENSLEDLEKRIMDEAKLVDI